MLHTEFGLQRLQGFPRVCLYTTSLRSNDRFKLSIVRMTVASHSHNGTIVACVRVQIPLVTSTSAHVRSEISDRHGSAHGLWTRIVPTARRCACEMLPAVRVWGAARLGEPVQIRFGESVLRLAA
jgi:hypothetical protein